MTDFEKCLLEKLKPICRELEKGQRVELMPQKDGGIKARVVVRTDIK